MGVRSVWMSVLDECICMRVCVLACVCVCACVCVYAYEFVYALVVDICIHTALFSNSGITLKVRNVGGYLAIQAVTGSRLLKNNTAGLLGVYNGNQMDDLTTPDGTVLDIATVSENDIYHNFGELCMIIMITEHEHSIIVS